MIRAFQVLTSFYACWVIVVGLWRDLVTGDSPQAIWFALGVAGLAFVGMLIVPLRRGRWPGLSLIAISLFFEIGWFGKRLFTHETDGLSFRVILILAICFVQLWAWFLMLWLGARRPAHPSPE